MFNPKILGGPKPPGFIKEDLNEDSKIEDEERKE